MKIIDTLLEDFYDGLILPEEYIEDKAKKSFYKEPFYVGVMAAFSYLVTSSKDKRDRQKVINNVEIIVDASVQMSELVEEVSPSYLASIIKGEAKLNPLVRIGLNYINKYHKRQTPSALYHIFVGYNGGVTHMFRFTIESAKNLDDDYYMDLYDELEENDFKELETEEDVSEVFSKRMYRLYTEVYNITNELDIDFNIDSRF